MPRSIIILASLFVCSFLLGCQRPVPVPGEPAGTNHTSATPPALPTPTAQATPTTNPGPCSETSGKVVNVDIPTVKLTRPINTNIYLPPCYDPDFAGGYPLLIMLHGQAGMNDQWLQLGLVTTADNLISNGEIQPLIIAMPYEITWRLGPEQSLYGEALVEEGIAFLEEQFAVCSKRSCRAIGGLSRGGNWAVYLGFKHPDVFALVGGHSSPLFFGELRRIETAASLVASRFELPQVYVDVGDKDSEKSMVLDFVAELDKSGVVYQFHEFEGRHEDSYWQAHTTDYLKWYSTHFIQPKSN